ncbi:MAG: hypothetical protein CVU94_02445 [Firmicutes bacterium HGW-Firmicutes-19]|jgi:hypothetical protein|nr:MAG: hypothetical protein CVU94_02445 [Firmicutes bacterium HGW-Firmicutes-19]
MHTTLSLRNGKSKSKNPNPDADVRKCRKKIFISMMFEELLKKAQNVTVFYLSITKKYIQAKNRINIGNFTFLV